MIKKILFVTHTFLPESYGGAEQQTLKITNELNNNNYYTEIICPRTNSFTPKKNKIKNVNITRLKVKHLPSLGGFAIFSFIVWFIKVFYWSIFNIKNFDAIYVVHGRLHSIPFALVSKIFRKKLIIKIGRGGELFDLNQIKKKKIIGNIAVQILISCVSAWVSNSKEIYKNLKFYKIKKKKIFNIFNGEEFLGNEKKNKNNIKNFLYFGRFDEEKNIEFLIKSFAKLNKNLNYRLTLIGDGTQKKQIKKLIKFCNLEKKVFIKNKTNLLLRYFKKNHFYVSASVSEGMSNSLLEASAYGLPSLSSKVSGVEDIISDNKNGFIFNLNNEWELNNKLTRMIKMSEKKYLRFSKNIQKVISNKFTIQKVAKKHADMFEIISKKT